MAHLKEGQYKSLRFKTSYHPSILRMQSVRQLGQIGYILNKERACGRSPARVIAHTRADHSNFSADYAEMLIKSLDQKKQDRTSLHSLPFEFALALFYHDIGHPFYSHAGERSLVALEKTAGKSRSHEGKGIELFRKEKDDEGRSLYDICEDENKGSGDLVIDMMSKHIPGSELWLLGYGIATDPVLSPDKHGYTKMDSEFISYEERPVSWDVLHRKITIGSEGPGIDVTRNHEFEGRTEAAFLNHIRFLQQAYLGIYYNSLSAALQRHIELSALDILSLDDTVASLEEAWRLTDKEFDNKVIKHKKSHPDAFEHMQRVHKVEPYAPCFIFVSNGHRIALLEGEETVKIEEEKFNENLETYNDAIKAQELEKAVQEHFGVRSIYVNTASSKRWKAGDANVYDRGEFIGTLKNRNPRFYESLRDEADRERVMRLRVHEEDYLLAKKNRKKIVELIFDHLSA